MQSSLQNRYRYYYLVFLQPGLWEWHQEHSVETVRELMECQQWTEEELHKAVGTWYANSVNLELGPGRGEAAGYYPTFANLNHSCLPNTQVSAQKYRYKLLLSSDTDTYWRAPDGGAGRCDPPAGGGGQPAGAGRNGAHHALPCTGPRHARPPPRSPRQMVFLVRVRAVQRPERVRLPPGGAGLPGPQLRGSSAASPPARQQYTATAGWITSQGFIWIDPLPSTAKRCC